MKTMTCSLAIALFLFLSEFSMAQTKAKCPPVTAKNTQEALMIEGGGNKEGCWVRDRKTGKLEFVSTGPANYKPLAPPESTAKQARPAIPPATGVIGLWDSNGYDMYKDERCPSAGNSVSFEIAATGSPNTYKIRRTNDTYDIDKWWSPLTMATPGRFSAMFRPNEPALETYDVTIEYVSDGELVVTEHCDGGVYRNTLHRSNLPRCVRGGWCK